MNTLAQEIQAHINSHYPIIYLITQEEDQANLLIDQVLAGDERKKIEWNLGCGFVNYKSVNTINSWCSFTDALENLLLQDLEQHVIIIRDAHVALTEPLAVARLKMLVNKFFANEDAHVTIIMIGAQAYIPHELEKLITLFDLPLPNRDKINDILTKFAHVYEIEIEQEIKQRLNYALQGLSYQEILHLLMQSYQNDGAIDENDIPLIQQQKSQIIKKSGILEMIEVQDKFSDIGGLYTLKPWLEKKAKIIKNFTKAQQFGVEAPKGVLIAGMPGCGKSLTAKATAALFEMPLLKLDIGSIMGKYVGESEANMRKAIKVAEAVSPSVLWVDELEKAFVGIGQGNASSEVATRLFGFFLTWMQEKTSQVFVIATANDISNLPPELMRKGRFDEVFYVDFPALQERHEIFKVHLNKRNKMNHNISINELAEATENYSGADIESIIKEAIEESFIDNQAPLDTRRLRKVIKETHPLGEIMSHKVKEYKKRFEDMKIKSAS
ncbi:MAG: AAA family ATPase [Proteobacteria bacterium]|nr:MAG: AAA family ATPase [Pseudomonadota bacterium]